MELSSLHCNILYLNEGSSILFVMIFCINCVCAPQVGWSKPRVLLHVNINFKCQKSWSLFVLLFLHLTFNLCMHCIIRYILNITYPNQTKRSYRTFPRLLNRIFVDNSLIEKAEVIYTKSKYKNKFYKVKSTIISVKVFHLFRIQNLYKN